MLKKVAVILQPPVALFEFGVLTEVFGVDRSADGVPKFEYVVCTENPDEPLDAGPGTFVTAAHSLHAAAGADLVAVPSSLLTATPSEAVLTAIRDADHRGAYVMSLCSGAFALAAAGLLNDRTVAIHWRYADRLAREYPQVRVDADILYAQDGRIISSAGTAAGIDACLHVVRTELGTAVANRIARRMVVSPHRDGGQKQFIERPAVARSEQSLQPTLDWMTENIAHTITVAAMARVAGVAQRTLTRRFMAEVGLTPHAWLTRQRVARVQELLEDTRLSVEDVAAESGFGTAPLLRHHFTRLIGITPTEYRKRFVKRTSAE
ncbi:helix-turn-helix domain-containing protein [Arthrobacter sp. CAN_C5]|uniref:helix-turn-helix domain-containing protein n=1 Tax=Arthrobacter sp. CAN_C5 TaxID=2760706 RepID=UPI001AE263F2|nr:helix-turn-helix domain-containing protein [Arthrobacter sp. CAN_C5]MBP2216962.1 transcriptional regulator GlxA family with amidase domain [Arthrobacter sp. CAN_C5]